MAYDFFKETGAIPKIDTKYRKIVTKIPVPESLPIFEEIFKYEARSMHGQLPILWDKAEDSQVFDKYGNCWIDFTSTIFLTNTGHSNPHVIDAIRKQLDQKLIHTYTFMHEIRAKFLKKLVEMTPDFCEKAFLLSAGTEACECALKLMRMYGQTISKDKVGIVSFKGCMHGRTMGAELLRGIPASAEWIGCKDPNMSYLTFPYPWSVEDPETHDWRSNFRNDMDNLKNEGVDFSKLCGFMIESYQGWGAIFYPKEYIQELVKFAKEQNMLVVFDEIQSGFGRTGKLFAYEHYEVEPDFICLGKALSGSLPLSAVIGRKSILDLPGVGSMSSTHSANPLTCAAALANLEEFESKNLVAESARKGKLLHRTLNEIKEEFSDFISGIIGKGMVAALLIKNPKTGEPDGLLASRICERAMQKGLILVHTGRESIKIGPPLTISDEILLDGLTALKESMQEICLGVDTLAKK